MKRPARVLTTAFLAIVFTFFARTSLAAEPPARSWMEGFALIELETTDTASLHEARRLVHAYGGRIAIISPPSVLMGWLEPSMSDELVGRAGIRDIHFTEVRPGEVREPDAQTRHMVRYFNRVVRGEYEQEIRRQAAGTPAGEWPASNPGDMLLPEPLDLDAYRRNLEANGFDLKQLEAQGLMLDPAPGQLVAGNSDRMVGTVTATLVFVESDGSGADPDAYTWTDAAVQSYIDGVNTGLAWWSSQAQNYTGCWVAFFVRYFAPTDPRCHQWREMVMHPSSSVAGMASDVMANFGYPSGGHFTQVDAFNTAQRSTWGTDWAYTGFVAYNPPPAPAELTNGTSAFAYFGGPYTFLLYRSFGWPVDQVFTHESGHIFHACDEYASSNCDCNVVCSNGALNGNCANGGCPPGPCMMKLNTFNLCAYTDEHIGWGFSPCAPAPLASPSVVSMNPTAGFQGTSGVATITGANFLYGAFADLGAGITITSETLVNATTIDVEFDIDNVATPGGRSVRVTNRDMQVGSLSSGFTVTASTRHYVSASGSNAFPYLSPPEAATTIAAAIAAAETGDTILVQTGSFSLTNLLVDRGVTVMGAWDGSFTSRDLASGRTVLDLTQNVSLSTGGDPVALDGFILQNGSGTIDIFPASGDFGGGVRIVNTPAEIRNCEIRMCTASGGAATGFGGAISAVGSPVTIVGNHLHDNTATIGGALYLYDCTGVVSGNTIEDNSVFQVGMAPSGGGIAMENCNGLDLDGNMIVRNTGAQTGGGVSMLASPLVSVTSGTIASNSATLSGGGIYVGASTVSLSAVEFRYNSGVIGGGVNADGASVSWDGCQFVSNTASIGGGVYATGGTAYLRHNLFVENSATSSGGAAYLSALAGGEVKGNTLDRNGGASSLQLQDSPVAAFNNIVANSAGDGVACGGTALPTLSYNLVTGSSGSDWSGCVAGPGSGSWAPAFTDTAGGDYHLGLHSGAIDAGHPDPAHNDPDGSRGDMGAFGSHSFVMQRPAYVKNLSAQLLIGDVVLSWDTEPGAVAYAIYCDSLSGFKPGATTFVMTTPDSSANLGAPSDSVWYVVNAVDVAGYAGGYSAEDNVSPATAAGSLQRFTRLYQNVPNPFNPITTIRYELAVPGVVQLDVYDVAGRRVRSLVDARQPAGLHEVLWDGTGIRGKAVGSGVYFYRLTTAHVTETRKMVLLK